MTSDFLIQTGKALLGVLSVGLLVGAGLPTVFSLGMRSLMLGRPLDAKGEPEGKPTTPGLLLGALFFAIVVAAIVYGILIIIFGKAVLPH